ncbi:Chitinase class I [compost metagenome]
MQITKQQLLQILPNAGPVAGVFVPAMNDAMARFKIDSRLRAAAFLAQVGHESGHLRQLVENLNYSAKGLMATWPTRFDATLAAQYARQPERIAAAVYNGRMGNTAPGDGWRYRGRGLIQVTGKANYQNAGAALGLDLVAHPELLKQPGHAAMSAAWYWSANGLNELADAGQFEKITRKINGGLNGQVERVALRDCAATVLV